MSEWTSDMTNVQMAVRLDSATASEPPFGRLVVMSAFERDVLSHGWPDDIRDKLLALEAKERHDR